MGNFEKITILVPVYNEEGNVVELHREIMDVCEKEGYDYEIIFINLIMKLITMFILIKWQKQERILREETLLFPKM